METQFKIIGVLFITLALVHIIFPQYFQWKKEFKGLSLINKQIMYVHTFFIALVVFLMGILCILFAPELLETTLGHAVILGLTVFWTFRLLIQLFGYSSKLWIGKPLETGIHLLFLLFLVYINTIFWWSFLIYNPN